MAKLSAGIVPFRRNLGRVEIFLAHPGGPFWAKKDLGAWSIVKGEYLESDDAFKSALREFGEETGKTVDGNFIALDPIKQPSGKIITAWAVEWDCNPHDCKSNTFTLEWPKGSGVIREFPEVDRVDWFDHDEALRKIIPGQAPIILQVIKSVNSDPSEPPQADPGPKKDNDRGSAGQLSMFD